MEEQDDNKSGEFGSPKKGDNSETYGSSFNPEANSNSGPSGRGSTPESSGGSTSTGGDSSSSSDDGSSPEAGSSSTGGDSSTPAGGDSSPSAGIGSSPESTSESTSTGRGPSTPANDSSSTEGIPPARSSCEAIRNYISSRPRLRLSLIVIAIAAGVLLLLSVPLYLAPALQHSWGTSRAECPVDSSLLTNRAIKRQIASTKNEITRLERRLASFIPTQTYIVINTIDNRFSLYRSRKLLLEGFCSSGSYTLLRTEDGEQEWIFKTPRGRFTILGKITHPVWRKPDWAFVEEGLPIPGPTDASRYEYGVLGDYAMSLGDGYLIHGTLYKRLLGMPVTHGCIRLNDDDLEAVFNALSVGSKVYIY